MTLVDPIEVANLEWQKRIGKYHKYLNANEFVLKCDLFVELLAIAKKNGLRWEAEFPENLSENFSNRSTLLEALECSSNLQTILFDLHDPDYVSMAPSKQNRELDRIPTIAQKLHKKLHHENLDAIRAFRHVFDTHIELVHFTTCLERLAISDPVPVTQSDIPMEYYLHRNLGVFTSICCASTGKWQNFIEGNDRPWAFLNDAIYAYLEYFEKQASSESIPDEFRDFDIFTETKLPIRSNLNELGILHIVKKILNQPATEYLPKKGSIGQ